MIFIYSTDVEVVPNRVNGKGGLAIHLDPTEEGFGEDDYMGDELLFEDPDVAWTWGVELLRKLAAESGQRVRVDVLG